MSEELTAQDLHSLAGSSSSIHKEAVIREILRNAKRDAETGVYSSTNSYSCRPDDLPYICAKLKELGYSVLCSRSLVTITVDWNCR